MQSVIRTTEGTQSFNFLHPYRIPALRPFSPGHAQRAAYTHPCQETLHLAYSPQEDWESGFSVPLPHEPYLVFFLLLGFHLSDAGFDRAELLFEEFRLGLHALYLFFH